MDDLGERYNVGQEELYVRYELDGVGSLPLCIHRTLHFGAATLAVGDLKQSSQKPLERRVGKQKGMSGSFREPYKSFKSKSIVHAQIEILGFKSADVAAMLASLRPPKVLSIPLTSTGKLTKTFVRTNSR
ncbi:hypothetical protein RQP46_010103 [Phenoliferia psychrophenolica]